LLQIFNSASVNPPDVHAVTDLTQRDQSLGFGFLPLI
jgi:hypothetical protein